MKKNKFFLIIILFTTICFCEEKFLFEKSLILSNSNLRNIQKFYSNSEVLKYKIYWEFVYAGEAEMNLIIEEIDGRKIYHIITQTRSNPSIDLIYKVRNKTESFVDFHGFYTLKFVKEQNEAGYFSKDYVLFDHKNNLWYYLIDNTTGYIPTFVQDVVSALYWLRLQNIELGKSYIIDVWVGKVVYPMVVDVLEIKKIKIFGKEYNCFKVEPKVDLKSFPLFKAKGSLFVYITADEKKLPVRLESKVFIGRVFADLVEVK